QVGGCEGNQARDVSRIELTCALEIVCSVSPATLTAVDQSARLRASRIDRQPSDPDGGRSIRLARKRAGYWVNSVEQEQVRLGHGRNRNIPSRDPTPAPGALPPNPASTEMQNLWPTLPRPDERAYGPSPPDKPNRVRRLTGNRRERSWDHE